ncbi:hypothetical protein RJ640_016888 [Escallonia rubra]|uniref:ALOG domain-containing protein n=1 Tax=Escallonia rubra TaxID=112253 RepID=A0AA88R9D8_9ASTE|nr:hypothetical protein RJ640_016888 [Escallonia rubra]
MTNTQLQNFKIQSRLTITKTNIQKEGYYSWEERKQDVEEKDIFKLPGPISTVSFCGRTTKIDPHHLLGHHPERARGAASPSTKTFNDHHQPIVVTTVISLSSPPQSPLPTNPNPQLSALLRQPFEACGLIHETVVHAHPCPFFGHPSIPAPCPCPLRQVWVSLDALIGRLRVAFEENGGKPKSNPFGTRGFTSAKFAIRSPKHRGSATRRRSGQLSCSSSNNNSLLSCLLQVEDLNFLEIWAGLDDNLLSSLSHGSNRIQSNGERVFEDFNVLSSQGSTQLKATRAMTAGFRPTSEILRLKNSLPRRQFQENTPRMQDQEKIYHWGGSSFTRNKLHPKEE